MPAECVILHLFNTRKGLFCPKTHTVRNEYPQEKGGGRAFRRSGFLGGGVPAQGARLRSHRTVHEKLARHLGHHLQRMPLAGGQQRRHARGPCPGHPVFGSRSEPGVPPAGGRLHVRGVPPRTYPQPRCAVQPGDQIRRLPPGRIGPGGRLRSHRALCPHRDLATGREDRVPFVGR